MFLSKRFIYILISFMVFLLFFTPRMISPMTKHESVFAAQIKTEKKQKEKVKMTVEYKGKIYRDLETHYYLFSTSKKGTIDISWGPDTLGSDYIITDKNWSAMYGNGNELPAGDYMLVITSNPAESPEDPSLISYHFMLKGLTFKEAPDTTLPKLTIESPAQLVTHLPAGEHDVTFKGCSDAASLNFTDEETTEQLPNSFEKTIHFDESSPNYRAYRITATNESGNSVNRYFEFIYDGGISE
jgi:ABC-type molybdate transport system substrate-binding protein